MTDNRDPRLNPMPGDVLESPCIRRTVTRIGGSGEKAWILYRSRGRGNWQNPMYVSEWSKWASTATVIKKAEEKE